MSTAAQHESTTAQGGFTLRHLTMILLVIGLVITGYLSYTHLASTSVICVQGSSTFDCDAVNNSIYSQIMGIPVAYLGFLADLFMLVILLLEPRVQLVADYGVMVVFAVALLGFIYHGYLTYVSFSFIGKLCPWCLSAHAVTTLVLIVTGIRLYRQLFRSENAEA